MIASLLLASFLGAPATPTDSQPSVAVYPLAGINLDSSAAQLMTEALSTEVLRTGLTRMLERPQIRAILTEQGFLQSEGCSSSECAVQIGRLLGVDRMIVGSVGSIDSVCVINTRLVDVATGEVLSVSSRSAPGGASAFLGAGIRQVAHELIDDRIVAEANPPKSRQDRKPTSIPTDSVATPIWSYAIPDLQFGAECMGFTTHELDYSDLAFGTRLRLWWQLPLRGLAIGGGGWYADNLVRSTYIDPWIENYRDFGIHVYGASVGVRENLPIDQHFSAALMAEQSWGRFIFDSESESNNNQASYPADYGTRAGSDRWETLTWIGLQLAYSPSPTLPLSFSLAYGPGWLSSELVHRAELACNYSFR